MRYSIFQAIKLFLIRITAAFGSLISVILIVRIFPQAEAGLFFVFIAATQFIAGVAFGPLSTLAIRFGSIYRFDKDYIASGRLFIFSTVILIVTSTFSIVAHVLLGELNKFFAWYPWVFTVVVGLSGVMIFLSGLLRAHGELTVSIIPEYLIKPLGIAVAAIGLLFIGARNFESLSIAYCAVMAIVCLILIIRVPWTLVKFSLERFSLYQSYIKDYCQLIVYGVFAAALTTFDILILSFFSSVDEVAAYKPAIQYAMLLTTGVVLANFIYGPKISIAYRDGDKVALQRLAKSTSRLSLLFFGITFLPLLTGPWFFKFILGGVGESSWGLALILCISRFVNSWFGSVTNLASLTGHATILSRSQGISFFCLLIFGPLLGQHYGSYGIALISSVVHIIWVLFSNNMLKNSLGIKLGPM